MIKELAKLLDLFPGPENQTRCFTHVLNLIAKSIIRQFDVPKAQQIQALDDGLQELQMLAADIELEERATRDGVEFGSDEDEDDNTDGWIDERERMSADDVKMLDDSVQPVRFMLVKVFQSPTQFGASLTSSPIAAQNCICNQKLFNNYSSTMVPVARGAWTQFPHDAT